MRPGIEKVKPWRPRCVGFSVGRFGVGIWLYWWMWDVSWGRKKVSQAPIFGTANKAEEANRAAGK